MKPTFKISVSALSTLFAIFILSTICAQENKAFLNPPEILKSSTVENKYLPENRKFSGIPSFAISPKGRMWAVWYAGKTPGEDLNNYVVVSTSEDSGENWEEVLIIDPDGSGPVRAYDPEIWIDTEGKLWIFWAQASVSEGGTWSLIEDGTLAGVWSLKIDNPESNEPVWNSPKRLADGVMMCKPIFLSTGEWVLPVSLWKMEEKSARMVVSTDKGNSWKVRGGASVPNEVRTFDEHMIVERKDGSLWMLIRTKNGIGECVSKDRGYTWTNVIPSAIQNPSARFFIYRLHSGNLLLVKNGPTDMRTGRSHLMAFISEDDGFSWSDGLLLDERPGIAYPDGQQFSNGSVFIAYDYNRTKDQLILLTSFTEDDIVLGSDNKIIEVYNRRKVISQGGNSKK